ncbi:MAG: Gfo/Idh/MocA family oxidoreductase [Chloroflexota bacterium]
MIKSVIIAVSGGRARGLADAYQHVKRGQLVAVSTRQENKLNEFADKYGVESRYTDYREMFAKEKPDLVHVNTPPNVRLEIFEAAEEAGVAAVLVEKPLAIQGEDYIAIRDFAKTAKVKIAINHQLHFHPRRQHLQNLVQDGAIGEIRFIEASSGMNLAYQGTHTLQAIGGFNPNAKPINVFGQVSGANGLAESPKQHFAPDQCVGSINYDNGVSAMLRCGDNAPRVPGIDDMISKHKRIAVYGTKGFIHWTMHGWESTINNVYESGQHTYGDEDILGQAAMTEAMINWIDDDQAVHPLNLDSALSDFSVVLGIYQSALTNTLVDLPIDPQPDLIAKLRAQLS